MGTTMWETAKSPAEIVRDEYRPYQVRMWTSDREAAAIAVVVPVTDENREDLAKVYAFPANADSVTVASVIKHDGTLHRDNRGQRRTVSVKCMSEDMGPYYTGGATGQFMLTLTPLKPRPSREEENYSLWYAHEWRERCGVVVTA